MDKNFIPYKDALDLRELGFDEPCIGFYSDPKSTVLYHYAKDCLSDEYRIHMTNNVVDWVNAPLITQALRWLREKYGLYGFVEFRQNKGRWGYHVYNLTATNKQMENQHIINLLVCAIADDYDGAQLLCVREIIERAQTMRQRALVESIA